MHRVACIGFMALCFAVGSGCSKGGAGTAATEESAGETAGTAGAPAGGPHGAPAGAHGAPAGGPHGAPAGHGGGDTDDEPAPIDPATYKPERNPDGTKQFGLFRVTVPESFQETPTGSDMRAARFLITHKEGNAELIVYYFGNAGAGALDLNLKRWYSHFEQEDGSATTEASANRKDSTVAGLTVTSVNVKGKYVAPVQPGDEIKYSAPNYQMLAAIVQTPEGPYYFKLVGSQVTLATVEQDFHDMIGSIKVKQ